MVGIPVWLHSQTTPKEITALATPVETQPPTRSPTETKWLKDKILVGFRPTMANFRQDQPSLARLKLVAPAFRQKYL
jgi:hypothetical protein